jgi:exodeoxyribonuclease V alpha subunit
MRHSEGFELKDAIIMYMADSVLTINGEVSSIRRFDSGWCIASIVPKSDDDKSLTIDAVTIVGTMPGVTEGMNIAVTAKKSVHEKYGTQYKVVDLLSCGYSTLDGLKRYLAGDDFPDVGDVTATLIVNHFGENVVEILDADPERVFEVKGANSNRLKRVAELWVKARNNQRGSLELIKLGLTSLLAHRVIKHFDNENILDVLKSNPYRLTEVRGIGFTRADEVALRCNILTDSPRRIEAAIKYTLDEYGVQGHCYMNTNRLIASVCDLLTVESSQVGTCINTLRKSGDIVIDGASTYSSEMYNAEVEVAGELIKMIQYPHGTTHYDNYEQVESDLEDFSDFDSSIKLDGLQLQAIMTALNERVCVITGGPGTGKTTITRALVSLLDKHGYSYELCSPTGRAAKRLSESSGKQARTIHRLLSWQPSTSTFMYNASLPLTTNFVLVDEFSMVDLRLFRDLLRALETSARIVIIGDKDQLPSVGAGNVLHDIIDSGVVPVVRLNKVFRQETGNTIVDVAHSIVGGEIPELPTPKDSKGKNCMMVNIGDDASKMQSFILQLITKEIPKLTDDSGANLKAKDVQILTPRRTGKYSVDEMNPWMQDAVNPEKPGVDQIKDGHRVLRVGDRVMQIRNNYALGDSGVFNGDIGYIVSSSMTADGPLVGVRYPDIMHPVEYDDETLDQIQHAWVSTVHKSQGSEIPVVIFVLQSCHGIMLQRNLLYTGVTRAKRICLIMGEHNALVTAINNDKVINRNTGLSSRLQEMTGVD